MKKRIMVVVMVILVFSAVCYAQDTELNECFKEATRRNKQELVNLDLSKIQENYSFIKKAFSTSSAKEYLKETEPYFIIEGVYINGQTKGELVINCHSTIPTMSSIKKLGEFWIKEFKHLENLDKDKFITALKKEICPQAK